MAKSTPMTKAATSRIQSATAKNGGNSSKGSFPARAQSTSSKTSNQKGGK